MFGVSVHYCVKSLVNIFWKPKSNNPKNAAKMTDIIITIIVYHKVCCLVGQLTFAISTLTSFKNCPKSAIFIYLKIARGRTYILSNPPPLCQSYIQVLDAFCVRLDEFFARQNI